MKKLILISALALPCVANAAYCFEPSTPYGGAPRRPNKPICASMRNCSQWEISSYQNEMEDYVRKLKRYVEEANMYAQEALEYAKCQLRNDD